MAIPRWIRVLCSFVLVAFLTPVALTAAQDATPIQATPIMEPSPVTPVAAGLTNPRGFTWGADGTMYVALAGSGGPNAATETAPTSGAIGPFFGGSTGAVAEIDPGGCPVAVVTGLPSTADAIGGILGAEDVAILGDQLYAGVDGGGGVHGNPDDPSGVYRLNQDGTWEVIADLSAWVRENPVEVEPGDFDPDAAGYSVVADEAAGLLWVVDPNSGQILTVTPDGEVARVADLSANHPVPTRLALDPEGGVFVGMLTTVPFPDGASWVVHVSPDGEVETVWQGLTTVTDVAVGDDGALYALEMSTGNLQEPPFLQPGSGRVVKQVSATEMEVVAEGLMFPNALELGPDGEWYVALPSMGANGGEGMIVRLGEGEGIDPAACSPIPETLSAAAGSPVAGEVDEADQVEGEEADAGDAESVTVTIADFSFGPDTLEISAGTTVTFVNEDSASHTATADDGSFDTGNIDGGGSAEVTFDEPGTYTYVCKYHPNMKATIVVT